MRPLAALAWISTTLLCAAVPAEELLRLAQPDVYELKMQGFELPQRATIQVDAVGRWPRGSQRLIGGDWFGGEDENRLSVYAWILDSDTREAVWVMEDDDTERFGRSRTLRELSDKVELEAGRYELYFWSGHLWHQQAMQAQSGKNDKWQWFGGDRDDLDDEDLEEDLKECYVALSSEAVGKSSLRLFTPDGRFGQPLIRLTGVGDSELERQAFRLRTAGELRAYVLLEHGRDDMDAADFAYIVDLASGRWVWESSSRRGRDAGGATKNRKFDSVIRLDAGDYLLCYGSDDSHSLAGFNADPPDDPLNWGVTLFAGEGFSAADLQLIDAPARGKAEIEFTRVGDSEFFEQPFRLAKETKLHVYALGEMDSDGWVFYDYGWIADASSGETVWEMDDRNTYPAGGAEKNRMFDGEVTLPAGDYILFYVTDDSHSFKEWNAAAPFDPAAWGIAIGGSGIQRLDDAQLKQASGVLASLVRVGDDERERARFELAQDAEVEIYAVGEGVDDQMYDYGKIRNRDTGRVVWEMEYRDTEHAGGARKNRVVREKLRLPAGRYEVSYETDGSHSFSGWNDRRPDDPMSWGITVRMAR
jgi:hypothetical protein